MHIESIKSYECPSCGRENDLDSFCYGPYENTYHCGECGDEVNLVRERPAKWFSVVIYEVDRAYGGPEEGGWYYDCGSRINETVRTFPNTPEGIYEANRYLDSLHALRFPTRRGRWDEPRYSSRTYSEELPAACFPKHRPVYC